MGSREAELGHNVPDRSRTNVAEPRSAQLFTRFELPEPDRFVVAAGDQNRAAAPRRTSAVVGQTQYFNGLLGPDPRMSSVDRLPPDVRVRVQDLQG